MPKTALEIQKRDLAQLENVLKNWNHHISDLDEKIKNLLLKKLNFLRTIQEQQKEIRELEAAMEKCESEKQQGLKEVNTITEKILTAYKKMLE